MPCVRLPSLAAAWLLTVPLAQGQDAVSTPPVMSLLKQIDQGFVAVFDKVAPTVVVIEAVKKDDGADEDTASRFERFFRDQDESTPPGLLKDSLRAPRETQSEGSGFVIRPDGYILTNHHVVADAKKLDVRLKDGRHFPAKLVAADDRTDVAVVKIDATGLAAAELGDSDALKVGQLVCAIGAPFNQDYSFTCGWVSGKGRSNLLGPTSKAILYEDYIQTDAFINPGNSGGPLFDVDGKVVGMNTLINGIGRGLAFAIPSSMLADVSQQLITDGKVRRSWLGIRIETLGDNASLRDHLPGVTHGVVVTTIEANAPAYKSDLRHTDVITDVDGVAVNAAIDLQKAIVRKKVGQTVQLTVWRGGKTLQIPVSTGELPPTFTKVSSVPVKKNVAVRREILGLKLKDQDDRRVVVSDVADGSPAAKAGVLAQDVLVDVETKPVVDASLAVEAIATSDGRIAKKGILLGLERKGKRTHAVLVAED